VAGGRKALVVATYDYRDAGLRRLAAPEHDAESFAEVLQDPDVAGFDVTMLVNEPHHVVGEAIADFYAGCRRDDLALLYFSGHGLKDDEGRLHLAMSNTRREALLFTAISAAQLNDAMDGSASRRKVLILDCCYSGAFPAGRSAKADEGVHTLERFQGKGRAVLTASDATQYAFEGDSLSGSGSSSVFTRYLVEAIRSGEADLDEDGDIALDELYSYVHERVVAEMPQQRPKKQEDVDGRILLARNVHWTLPAHLRHAIESPIAAQRLSAVDGLGHLHRVGNEVVRATVAGHLQTLADDDSRTVSAAATEELTRAGGRGVARTIGRVPTRPAPPARREPVPVVAPDPEPDAEHSLADWARIDGGPVPAPMPDRVTDRPPARVPDQVADGAPDRVPDRVADRAPETPSAAAPDARQGVGRDPVTLVLALVVLSALPLTLSRLLYFETGYPDTADTFSESTLPWTLLIVLPLTAAAGLLAARHRLPWALPVGLGLVLGSGLVLVEHATFWIFFFVQNSGSYSAGPGLWSLVAGAAVVAAAGVVVLTRSPVSGRPTVRTDWRVACALVVGACVLWFLAAGPDTDTGSWWFALYEGTLLLGAAALPITLLWLRTDQRIAALVAITLFGAWSVYFIVRELVAPELDVDPSVWRVELVTVVLTLLACWIAQAGPARAPAAEPSARR
jgi:hypothetical protein